ncbi:MAG: elongation factor G [Vicinamibacteria bacterium]|nr:elongation factor G [Vicinamibacteria bacterium]
MKAFESTQIRNVALVGHGGCGKTSIVADALFTMGVTPRLGHVTDGTAATDFDPEEIERKISIQTSVASGDWGDTRINLIDTPGYANFVGEALSALRAADAAIEVVDAVAGPEVQTHRLFHAAEDMELPRVFVINRMDREHASFGHTVEALRKAFGRTVTPIAFPIGEGAAFKGVVDLVNSKAFAFKDDESGTFSELQMPKDLEEATARFRQELVEVVAETDEALMSEFFEKGTLAPAVLAEGLKKACHRGQVFPALPFSSIKNIGAPQLLNVIVAFLPSPADRPDAKGKGPAGEETRACSVNAPASAFVFKTISDPHAGRLSFIRVISGRFNHDLTITVASRDAQERVGALAHVVGKTLVPATELIAGDIGVLAKLKEAHTGDTLSDKAKPITFPPIEWPETLTTFAIAPKTRGDDDKIGIAMSRLIEEDPVLKLEHATETHELLLRGLGQLHIETVVSKLAKRYKVEVNLKRPTIPYRETIKATADGHGRHKKQTGGHGQFADCKITMRPLPRGEDFKFINGTFGGSIPRNFLPAIEKGIQESRKRGYVAGCPMVDFEVEVTDGQFHDVDSSEMAFKIAGSLAFKDAVAKCRPTLLEPMMSVEVVMPEEFAGAVMGDLSSRRGRPQGMEPYRDLQKIKAEVPLAELETFDQDLTSLTGGRGSFHMELIRYDEVPGHLLEKVAAEIRAHRPGDHKEED